MKINSMHGLKAVFADVHALQQIQYNRKAFILRAEMNRKTPTAIVPETKLVAVYGPKALAEFRRWGFRIAFKVTLKAQIPFPDWVSPEEWVRLTDTGVGFGPIE